jgi:hypothetical protein
MSVLTNWEQKSTNLGIHHIDTRRRVGGDESEMILSPESLCMGISLISARLFVVDDAFQATSVSISVSRRGSTVRDQDIRSIGMSETIIRSPNTGLCRGGVSRGGTEMSREAFYDVSTVIWVYSV